MIKQRPLFTAVMEYVSKPCTEKSGHLTADSTRTSGFGFSYLLHLRCRSGTSPPWRRSGFLWESWPTHRSSLGDSCRYEGERQHRPRERMPRLPLTEARLLFSEALSSGDPASHSSRSVKTLLRSRRGDGGGLRTGALKTERSDKNNEYSTHPAGC